MTTDQSDKFEKYTPELIDIAAKMIAESEHLVILTGAGVSTDSGVPDFRSPETGIWTKISPDESKRILTDPKIFWKLVRELSPGIIKAKPNKSHDIISKLEKMKILKTLITQNIDGLHQQAGNPFVLELHGDATEFKCIACHGRFDAKKIIKKHKSEEDNLPPSCPQCGAQLLLNVVLFEQFLPRGVWLESVAECQKADVLLIIGSSLMVAPANQLPLYTMKYGGRVIIINNSPTDLDEDANIVLRGQSSEILGSIFKIIKKLKK